ncbi:chaperonin 10-like protein [Talaromyces proteolyticus]|uniref:Chaperonin 10-like protein n=1 Tax=Talaromyces proteolyticus TaxID=1131652 RepID=A0AAD4KZP4_9EURO|nr:chaperonin 10-like protein [Talaromyces proteolyticus]KAH8704868.1 chaperonin 10-like protein [Talaromyces proteolyticus]
MPHSTDNSSPSNHAAWLVAAKATPFEIKPAPYTPPGEGQVVIKTAAVAINPIDWKIQERAFFPLNYPTILGEDVAGEIFELGPGVDRFMKGDRVLAHALSFVSNLHYDSAFQEYVVVSARLVSPIPSAMSFEEAAGIPLALSTAAAGLFQKEHLALHYPSVNPTLTGKTLLIWGGASSVGSAGIQLAVSAGYEVVTTASPKNFDYVKSLGAAQVFDYNAEDVVDKLIEALRGKEVAGVLDTINYYGTFQKCVDVLQKANGGGFIASTERLPEELPEGVNGRWIFATTINDNDVSYAIYEDFLPKALEAGLYVAAPKSEVVGEGLSSVQTAINALKKGVSAKKLVVTL